MDAVLLIGIQASGKSTFCRERFGDTHIRLNLDRLRTRHREAILLKACLASKQRFVVDNMNLSREDRARYLPSAKAAGFRVVGYVFRSDLDECARRNESRPGKQKIPLGGLHAAQGKLEPPEFDEGFDEIHDVRIAGHGRFEVTARRKG